MQANAPDRLTLTAFMVSVIFGGLNAIGVRYVVAELPPFWGATIRFAPASLLLFLLVLLQRLELPRGRALFGAVVYGVLNFGIAYALAFWALQTVAPGLAMVVLALTPLLTLLFAILHRQENFSWRVFGGSLVSMAGIGLIFFQQFSLEVSLLPLFAIVLNAACFAEANVLIKGFPKAHPVTTNAIGMGAGTAVLFAASLLWGEPRPLPTLTETWLALGYLILIGSCVVFILALYVLKRWTASATSYALVLIPFVTILVSTIMGQETITATLIIGGALVLSGVYIGALRRNRKQTDKAIQSRMEKQLRESPTD